MKCDEFASISENQLIDLISNDDLELPNGEEEVVFRDLYYKTLFALYREYSLTSWGEYHCTDDLLFGWFEFSSFAALKLSKDLLVHINLL